MRFNIGNYQGYCDMAEMAKQALKSNPSPLSKGAAPSGVSAALRVPLYHQIYLILRQKILSSEFDFDERVPSEQELVDEYKVSRITARRALDELAAEGLVIRQRGKGTRVRFRPPTQVIDSSIEGLLENLLAMGLETSVSLLKFEYVNANDEVARALHCEAGTIVQRAVRVRSIDSGPFSYLVTYVPQDIGSNYDANDLASNPLLQLLERSGVTVDGAEQTITATLADADIATQLNTEIGAALLEVKRVVMDQDGRPVEYIRALYLPDQYQYHMVLSRVKGEKVNTWTPKESGGD
jgi:GntR family transcriptional regulator